MTNLQSLIEVASSFAPSWSAFSAGLIAAWAVADMSRRWPLLHVLWIAIACGSVVAILTVSPEGRDQIVAVVLQAYKIGLLPGACMASPMRAIWRNWVSV